ncbi:MAG: SulP family inorganic anion transporter [Pyrinomonadaceae bacterium]
MVRNYSSDVSTTPGQKVYRIRQRASGLFTDLNETARVVRLFPKAPAPGMRRHLLARLRGDIGGGVVSAMMTVPYGMALSLAIGLSPEAGLYTSIIGNVIAGCLSSSPVMVSGLSATAVPVLALVVKNYGVGAALTVGLMSGLVMAVVGLLRLGRFANYLPPSIVSAFTCGLGVVICSFTAEDGLRRYANSGWIRFGYRRRSGGRPAVTSKGKPTSHGSSGCGLYCYGAASEVEERIFHLRWSE